MKQALLIGAAVMAASGCAGTRAAAQDSIPWPAESLLDASIAATAARGAGDTITVTYDLSNAGSSEQAAWKLYVRTRARPLEVQAPDFWLGRIVTINDSSAINWMALSRQDFLQPGGSIGGFSYLGVGLLAVVGYRVIGYAPLPVVDEEKGESADLVQRPPWIWEAAPAGATLGVVTVPPTLKLADLMARLTDDARQGCALLWVQPQGVCRSLEAKLQAAAAALQRGQMTAARGQLQAFEAELVAQRGKAVSDEAFFLLTLNTDYLLRRMPS